MKRLISLLMILIISFSAIPASALIIFQQQPIYVYVNGAQIPEMTVYKYNNSVIVPYVEFVSYFGYKIDYDSKTDAVVCSKDKNTFSFNMGKNIASHNGKDYVLDVSPIKSEHNFYLSLDFLAEMIDLSITFDLDNFRVDIDSSKPYPKKVLTELLPIEEKDVLLDFSQAVNHGGQIYHTGKLKTTASAINIEGKYPVIGELKAISSDNSRLFLISEYKYNTYLYEVNTSLNSISNIYTFEAIGDNYIYDTYSETLFIENIESQTIFYKNILDRFTECYYNTSALRKGFGTNIFYLKYSSSFPMLGTLKYQNDTMYSEVLYPVKDYKISNDHMIYFTDDKNILYSASFDLIALLTQHHNQLNTVIKALTPSVIDAKKLANDIRTFEVDSVNNVIYAFDSRGLAKYDFEGKKLKSFSSDITSIEKSGELILFKTKNGQYILESEAK